MHIPTHIEDIFEEFYKLVLTDQIPIQHQDLSACYSFYETIIVGNLLTENQQRYILKILDKYKLFSAALALDYQSAIADPKWKNPIRIIDKSKKAWVEEEEENTYICLRFPFQLKEIFEKEFEHTYKNSVWDHARRIRKVSIYNINLLSLNEFLIAHKFEIDDSFSIALSQCEEIVNQQDQIIPSFDIVDNNIVLINASSETEQWWEENKSQSLDTNILLAKSMGFKLITTPTTTVEQIAAADTNQFWIDDLNKFLNLVDSIEGKICILIDRVSDAKAWIQSFVDAASNANVSRNSIKVCFRENKNEKTGFNEWVKAYGLGGPVDEGKILIFQHKPAKWLFKDPQSVKILATNNLYPSTNAVTKDWFNTHPCVIYIGNIKPAKSRNTKIVQL